MNSVYEFSLYEFAYEFYEFIWFFTYEFYEFICLMNSYMNSGVHYMAFAKTQKWWKLAVK